MLGKKLSQAAIRWPLALMFAMLVTIVSMPQAHAQHTSAECPPQTATVSAGGTVTIDITDCASSIGFVGVGAVDGGSSPAGGPYNFPDHGSAVTRRVGSQWLLDYSHNGTSGIGSSDVFEVTEATAANDRDVLVTITITAATSPLTVTPGSLPTLTAGTSFSQTITTTGGTGPYSYALQAGALPAGLSLLPSGVLNGTPTQRGAYSFSVRATDSTTPTANFVDKGYTGTVQNPSLALANPTVTLATGVAASTQLATNGGLSPHRYATEPPGAPMPFGLSLSSSGLITGTPASAGSVPVQLRVTDASTPSNAPYFELETLTVTVAALPTITIAVVPASVSEDGATNLVYTVTRSAASTSALTVNLTTGGTATSGTDYTGAVSTVTIPANATAATVTIDPTADANIEVNETVILTVATGAGYTVSAPASATGTILNDDVPSATISVAPASVSEDGADNLVYTVTLNQPSSNSITISYSLSGTATSGTDYVANPSVVTFAPGVTTAVIAVDPIADASIEANETVTVTLNAGAGYTVGAPAFAAGTIVNDDLPTLTINDVTLTEGNSGTTNATFSVSLSAPAGPSGVTFDITTAAGTATGSVDYVTRTLAAQTIPAGSSTYSFSVLVNGDSLSEPNETFFVNVTNVTNAIVGDGQGLGTINNDDVPTASIAVAPASTPEDGAQNLIYTVALDTAAAVPITVNFTLGGTATNGNDYNSTGSSVVIPAGTTSQTIVINPNPNGTIEPDETVIITLAAGTGYIVGAPASATGTILNDDLPSLFIDSVSVAEGNSGTTNAVFTISLSAPATASGVTFDIATANWFALAGQDYVANSQAGVLIPAGSSSTTFTVALNGDALNELDEGFFVRITNVSGAFVGGSQGIGTITNDDPLPTLSISSPSVVEGNSGTSTLNFLMTLDAPSAQIVSANVTTANGTATAGSDYAAATGSFAFQPGDTSKVFLVTVNGDTAPESDEAFTAVLSGVVNATIDTGSGTGTIVNDDVPLTILPTVLPNGSVGNLYSAILTTSGGTAPYSYTITSGTVPAGLTLSADGTLAGTPVAAGNSTFIIRTQDSSGAPGPYAASQTYSVTIAAPVIALTPASLPNATFGLPYSQTITADGSIAPYSFAVTSGSLPPGLTLAPNGILSGTPTLGGPRTFTVTATDATAAPYTGGRAYTLTVDVAPLVMPTTILSDGATDIAYSAQIDSATGGVAPYSYAVTSGDLPFGLSMSSTGAITGTPSTAGLFSFVVTATDSNAGSGPSVVQQSYTINIVNTPPIANPVTTSVAYGSASTPVPLSITGTANSVAVITPPTNGRAIVDRMTINYIPNTGFAGPDSFTYIASNNGANSAPALATINVGDAVITITPAGPQTAAVGTPYSQTFTFNGGTQPFTNYQVIGLPAGLRLGSSSANNVAIIGTPTSSGSFPLTVSATDSSTGTGPFTASAIVALTVSAPGLILAPGSGTINAGFDTPVSQSYIASGGTGNYSYAVTAGSLPSGITFDGATGQLSGRTVSVGSFAFTVTATDNSASGAGAPFTVSGNYFLAIAPPVIAIDQTTLPSATVARVYSQMITASGGIAPYNFALTSGSLPAGVTLSSNGLLSGTPGAGGNFAFTVTATDASGAPGPFTASQGFNLTVDAPTLTLPVATLTSGQVGSAYGAALSPATGGTAPYDYTVTGGILPAGITLSANGTLSGTPSAIGTFSFAVTATDSSTGSGPYTASQNYTIAISDQTPVAGPVSVNRAYGSGNAPVPLNLGGGAANSVAIVTGPANGTATVSGVTISYQPNPSFSGTDSFTYTATNAGGTSSPANVTVTVGAPTLTITPANPLTATVGNPYSETFVFNGGSQPFTNYQVIGLPDGLQLGSSSNNTIAIVGTPTRSGSFTLTVSARDNSTGDGPFTANASFTLTVGAPNLILTPGTGTFPAAFDAAVSQQFVASGGTGNYSYAVTTGTLPSGIAFDGATGQLSGRTVSVGNFAFTVTATDTGATGSGAPFTVAGNYILAIAPPVIAIDQTALPSAIVATSYTQTIRASGGVAPYSFAVTTGTLPAGMSMSSGGILSGTPSAGGSFAFTIAATDSSGTPGPFGASQAFNLIVADPTLTLPVTGLNSGQLGSAYNATLTPASGGTAPYSYAVTGGILPAGMSLSGSGAISGTPSAFGTFSFTVTATDSSTGSGPYSASQTYTIAIIDQPPIAGPVSVNRAYGSGNAPVPLNLSGGAANSVAIVTGPANGTASVSGVTISYQPNASFSGTDSFTYTATNAGGTSSPANVTVTIGTPILTITPANPLTATVGQAYSQTFRFTGGTGPFGSFNVSGLPAGLSLTGSTGDEVTISGSPSAQGNFSLIVSGTDASTGSGPFSISQTFSLAVAGPNLVLAPNAGSFSAAYAAPYSQSFTASGGVGPYSYALTGNLPAGVTLNTSTGALSGTPTASGSFDFTITATDSGATGNGAPFTVAGNYSVVVAAPAITVTPTALPAAIAGQNYATTLAAAGAVGPYNYMLTGGALPAGITLAAGGQLSGIASVSGSFAFVVQVRDANGQTGTANLTLNVGVPTLNLTPATLPAAAQGIAYSQTLAASGGIAPYSFAVTTGALPAGLTLNTATGVISGTPTASGTANFAITVSDSTGGVPATLTVNFALQVTARPDPALDPEVRGLVQAQVAATRRFADAQIDNFMQRMESMHGESADQGNSDGPAFSLRNNVRFSTPDYCRDAITMTTSAVCENRSRLTGIVPLNNWRAEGSTPAAGGTAGARSNGGSNPGGSGAPITIWAGGAIRFGERDATSGRASQNFESEGITIGADYRFSPSFAAGIGVGLGRDTVDVGDEGSQSRGEAKTIAVYASNQFGKGFFVDWLAGYQQLDFDLRRYVTLTGALVNARRTGDQWFGTMTAGADIERGNWQLTPYARLDIARATLNGYSESTGSMFDLAFLDQNIDFTSIGAGARFKYRQKTKWGELLPQLRAEYQWNVERSADARVAYTDQLSGPFSNISLSGIGREELTLGGKLEMLFVPDWALALEYIGRFSAGAGTDNMIQIGIKHEF